MNVSYQYPPPQSTYRSPQDQPPRWSPPPRARGAGVLGTALTMIVALLITPVGIGLFANGSRSTDRWETFSDSGDRLGPNVQIVGGAILLLLVAAPAAYAPTGTVVAGWVWGLIPGAVALLFPGNALRAIRDIPALPIETRLALSVWATDGGLLLIGALLLGAGLASALRRR